MDRLGGKVGSRRGWKEREKREGCGWKEYG